MNHFWENFRQARRAVLENRVRSMMSVIGIAVGIAAVLIVGTVSSNGKDYIYSELKSYGLESLWIYRKIDENDPLVEARSGSGISNDDLIALRNSRCCPNVTLYSPSVYSANWMINLRAGNNFSNTSVSGVDSTYLTINNDSIAYGRNFRQQDIERRAKVALIGSEAAKRLFGDRQNITGEMVRMGDMQFKLIGVMKEKNRTLLSAVGATQGYDENNRLLIPYTLYQQSLGSKDIHTLRASADSLDNVDIAKQQILNFLQRRNSGAFQYEGDSMLRWIETTNDIVGMISNIGALAALLALIVGGVGVYNIMSSSVIERTHEIGILKAIGAHNRDIWQQFILEAGFISAAGGLVGSLIGLMSLYIATLILHLPLQPSWFYLLLGLLVSMVVGIFAGFYPARRAAAMPPAVALRYT